MNLRSIPRTAVGGYIKAVRWPIDRTTRLLRRDGDKSGAELAVDRADAAARGAAGTVLGDEELKQDASRRTKAADERERAQALSGAARARAEQAEEDREAKAKRARQAEQRRKRAAEKAAAERKEAVEEQAKRERLEALER